MGNANHNPQQPQGETLGNGQSAGQYGQPGQGQYSHTSYNANTTYNTDYENGRPTPNANNGGERPNPRSSAGFAKAACSVRTIA